MTVTVPANGSTLTDATEQILSEITSDDDAYWGGYLFTPSAFTGTNKLEIKFYSYDINGATITGKIVYNKTIEGDQSASPAIYIPPTFGRRYRFTIKMLVGTNRTFTWYVIRQSG